MFPPGPPDDLPPPYHDDVIRREHEHMNHRIDLLETHIKRLETKLVHEHQIDRWTDPKNAACLIPYNPRIGLDGNVRCFTIKIPQTRPVNINSYLLKPLPNNPSSYDFTIDDHLTYFLSHHRHEYICPCYNCFLHDLFGTKSVYDDSKKPVLCPLDSDCTCMTLQHRLDFKHSIQAGLIKGRDTELSLIQRYYAQSCPNINIELPPLYYIPDDYKEGRTPDGSILISNRVNAPFSQIINCIKRDGIDLYQYKDESNERIIHETKDNLYTFVYHSDHRLYVPVEKYMADTHFLGKMPRKIKSRRFQKKRSTRKHHTPKR